MATKQQRLDEIYRRLAAAPCASSEDDAYRLLVTTIDDVEDELSGVANDPANWKHDQRIYPPQADRSTRGKIPHAVIYEARKHEILIGATGALAIVERQTGHTVLSKAGCDGTRVSP